MLKNWMFQKKPLGKINAQMHGAFSSVSKACADYGARARQPPGCLLARRALIVLRKDLRP